MPLTGTQLALTSARVGVMRVGAFRVGFTPSYTTGTTPGSSGGQYGWRAVYPPDSTWTLIRS